MPPLAIGIDLGTTNSVIAYINASGRPEVIPTGEGGSTTPSVIFFGADPPLVGGQAKEMQGLGEEEVASFFKRSMGDPYFLPHLGGKDRTAVELSALVLGKLKADAEAALKQPVTRAVITVPAYFNNAQREATIEAGRQAGLEVERIINEPTAAVLAYGLHKADRTETVLVYDLGGGTFDVSLARITPDKVDVIATAGDHNLGGKDWDDRIATFLGRRFAEAHGIDPLDDPASSHDLLVRAEKTKWTLSDRMSTRVTLHHGAHQERVELSRGDFEEMSRDLMERTQSLCEQVLGDAGLRWTELAGVLLVGGSTRMPMVHDYVTRMSGRPPMTGVNVDEAVALGAAIQAGIELDTAAPGAAPTFLLAGRKIVRDVTAHSLGVIVESPDRQRFVNSVIVNRNSPLPAEGRREYQSRVQRGGAIECIVYVTEGEGDDPRTVAVRGKYLCRGATGQPAKQATIRVEYAYDKNGTIVVKAAEATTGTAFEVVSQEVTDLAWLKKSPRELDTFDPSELNLLVTPPCYDDIGKILASLGLPVRTYAGSGRLECDIVFINCGTPTAPDADDLREFVSGGGCVYASDHADGLVSRAFPGLFEFGGHLGDLGSVTAEVADPELRTELGKKIAVTFDMPGWARLDAVAPEGRVLLRDPKGGKPLMAMAPFGGGTVFFTCFHNHAQASGAEQKLLQLLVLKQISVAAGVPIETVTNARGITWR
jgi:molecular chaperone DnaK